MAYWIGRIVHLTEDKHGAEVIVALETYMLADDEEGPPSGPSEAPLPRVGEVFRLISDDWSF